MTEYPMSPEDERCVVACCMEGGLDTSVEAVEMVPLDAFIQPKLREAFHVIGILAAAGEEINQYTVSVKWRELNPGKTPEEIYNPGSALPQNLKYHAESVVESWRKRRLLEACDKVISRGCNPLTTSNEMLEIAESALHAEESTSIKLVSAKQASERMIVDIERRAALDGKLSGIVTGFYKLDRKTEGLQFGEMTLVAARPSIGKTALGLNFVVSACLRDKVPTLFVSLEMGIEALMRRLLSAWAGIEMGVLRRGSYEDHDYKKMVAFQSFINKAPLWFVDGVSAGGLNGNQIVSAIRRRARKNGVKLVIVDYLQKIKPSHKFEKKTYEIGETSGMMKSVAEATKVALVCLAQLNRESVKDKGGRLPRLSDLADSGQIERDADTVVLLHRDLSKDDNNALFLIAKQRDGETGVLEQAYNGKYCRFENPEP